MSIVGIDLGTTNSLIARIERGGARLFPEPNGTALIPSVLYLDPAGQWTVGAEARKRRVSEPERVLYSTKRFIGRGRADVENWLAPFPFDFSPSDANAVRFRVGDKVVHPVEAAASILRHLKATAEAALGEKVDRAVVTVPAYFDDAQRQATKQAGSLAGLEVVRMINEPTAASLAYGLDKKTSGTVAVFDLGGGTFDVSILRINDGVFEVLATRGDTRLGGDDFDAAIASALASPFERETGLDVNASIRLRALLHTEAEELKKQLTFQERADVVLEFDGHTHRRAVTRSEMEGWITPVLARAKEPCLNCISDAGLSADQITDVILVGGSTRTPLVRRFVADLFQREPLCSLDPDQVVAVGAAVQANVLAGQSGEMLLLDVIPLSLGIETLGGVNSKLIHRNSTIPVSASETFSTYIDGQTNVDIHVVQGEREMVEDNRSLARFQLRGLPPLPAGTPKIEVEFVIDANGVLSVKALEVRTGTRAEITVNPTFGLNDEDVERMLTDSIEHAESDFEKRFLVEARQEAETVLRATRKSLASANGLLNAEERATIESVAAQLERTMALEDFRGIRKATESLDEATRGLAEKMMSKTVTAALNESRGDVR